MGPVASVMIRDEARRSVPKIVAVVVAFACFLTAFILWTKNQNKISATLADNEKKAEKRKTAYVLVGIGLLVSVVASKI